MELFVKICRKIKKDIFNSDTKPLHLLANVLI